MPHTINGWTPDLDAVALLRLHGTTERLRALPQQIPPDRALIWCLNRTEAIATSHVEGIVTTMRSLSLLESLRAGRDPERVERDRQALGAARLNACAAAVGARRSAPVTAGDLQEMHRRLFTATSQQIGSGEFRDEQNWVGTAGIEPAVRDLITRWRDSTPPQTGPRRLPGCTHIGERSRIQCRRRAGHQPPHRYT